MSKTITLDDATYNALIAALSTAGGTTPPPVDTGTPAPTPTPTPTPPRAPQFCIPEMCNGRSPIYTEVPWNTAFGRVYSKVKLNDSNVWLLGISTGDYNSGSFASAEWIDPLMIRNVQVIRNRDGAVVFELMGRSMGPGFTFCSATPPRMSGKIQLEPNERYTVAIWNAIAGTAGQMCAEMHFA